MLHMLTSYLEAYVALPHKCISSLFRLNFPQAVLINNVRVNERVEDCLEHLKMDYH